MYISELLRALQQAKMWLETSNSLLVWQNVAENCATDTNGVCHVPANAFLDAAETLATIFDLISGMSIAKNAMMDNITKIRKHIRPNDANELPLTLQNAILSDVRPVKDVIKDHSSVAHQLLWLSRGIEFLRVIITTLEQDAESSMTQCIRAGYEASLKPHHPLAVQGTVYMLAKAAPNRATFLRKICEGDDVLKRAQIVFTNVNVVHQANISFLTAKGFYH